MVYQSPKIREIKQIEDESSLAIIMAFYPESETLIQQALARGSRDCQISSYGHLIYYSTDSNTPSTPGDMDLFLNM